MAIPRKPTRAAPATSPLVDDQTLVAAVRAGDLDALGKLYERTSGMVYACAFRCLGSEAEAEDVLQDVFLGLPDALRSYDERGQFGAWIRRIAARTALMRMRQQQRLREDPLIDAPVSATDAHSRPVDRIAARDAIERLPDSLRVVFMLKEVEGYAHAEIADMLGITAGASAARLFRAWQMVLAYSGSHS